MGGFGFRVMGPPIPLTLFCSPKGGSGLEFRGLGFRVLQLGGSGLGLRVASDLEFRV